MELTINEPGVWVQMYSPYTNYNYPTLESIPHLSQKHLWKDPAGAAAKCLCDMLKRNGVGDPTCNLCGERCYIEDHLKSERHFKMLWHKIDEAQQLERYAGRYIMDNDIWYQDFQILSGRKTIRFSHIDLSIYVVTGIPFTRAPQLLQPLPPPVIDNSGYRPSPWQPTQLELPAGFMPQVSPTLQPPTIEALQPPANVPPTTVPPPPPPPPPHTEKRPAAAPAAAPAASASAGGGGGGGDAASASASQSAAASASASASAASAEIEMLRKENMRLQALCSRQKEMKILGPATEPPASTEKPTMLMLLKENIRLQVQEFLLLQQQKDVLEVSSDDVTVYWAEDGSISTLVSSEVARRFGGSPIDPKYLPLQTSNEVVNPASAFETAITAVEQPSEDGTRQPFHQLQWDVDARNGDEDIERIMRELKAKLLDACSHGGGMCSLEVKVLCAP